MIRSPKPTYAQESVLDKVCLDHGTCEISMYAVRGSGDLMRVECEDGACLTFNEAGESV